MHNRPNASVWDHYEEVKVIGHGMTGKVFMVQHKITREKYALKVRRRRARGNRHAAPPARRARARAPRPR